MEVEARDRQKEKWKPNLAERNKGLKRQHEEGDAKTKKENSKKKPI